MTPRLILGLLAACLVTIAAGCGGDDGGGGTITADGSSTVGPYVTKAAEDFQKENEGVQITVGISGTGGGFERFCKGETDLSNASRPIDEDEEKICADNGVDYTQFTVANDALTNIVNGDNDWATCLTVDQLRKIWEPGSTITNWNQVSSDFPDEPLKLFGPGTDSGTFDYFTDVITGEEGSSRQDFSASEDDNVIVQGVAGEKGGLGYLGFSYYEENADKLKALEVDDGNGCVAPSVETAQNGTYTPLARPLFVYASQKAMESDDVQGFIGYMLENETSIAEATGFVPLSPEQLTEQQTAFDEATGS